MGQQVPISPVQAPKIPDGTKLLCACTCGGVIVQAVHEVTAEIGGHVETRTEHDHPWCTGCGEEWWQHL